MGSRSNENGTIAKMYAIQHSFDKLPKYIFRQCNAALTSLIWAEKHSRVARQMLFRPLQQGGLAVPDLEQYYMATQLQPNG